MHMHAESYMVLDHIIVKTWPTSNGGGLRVKLRVVHFGNCLVDR